jgi:hypothetical protein
MTKTIQYQAWLIENDIDGSQVEYECGPNTNWEDKPVVSTWPKGVEIPTEAQLPTVEEAEAIINAPSPRVVELRNAYKTATRALCTLAGVEVVDKLEDEEFATVRDAARLVDSEATSNCVETTMYALFQLYRYDGENAWDNI